MKVAFYVNEGKKEAKSAAKKLTAQATSFGLVVRPVEQAEIIIALGGDGTILRCVHQYPVVPVLGFNLGGLGYLANVERKDFTRALESLAKRRYRIAKRAMLSVEGRPALNEVVIVREMTGHAATLDLAVDGKSATRYLADGIVIATPTGSTAYSLSAGGPVLMPDSQSFVVTPMNPHALDIRPVVVRDSARFTVTLRRRGKIPEKLGIYADGERVRALDVGESIKVERSRLAAKFVELEGYDPYETLSRKLGWIDAR